ncbi:MAG: hypothetical protein F8N39_05830 [Clostridiaceae bacterium]|nr:hypothetical protein [Clostridiaceae bacterium]
MTVSLYADAQLTTLVASQSRQVATTYSWGALQFGDPSWFTGVIDQERARFVPQPAMVLFPSPQFARYVLVQIDDTGNQDGYIELSRLFVTPGYQPSINIKYGSSAGVNDPTVSTRSPGGADFYDIRPKHRIITCQIDYLPKGEAFATHFMAQLRLGLSGQFFFSKFPSDQTLFALTSFIATLTKLDPITSACFGYQNAAYAIEEVVA